MTKAAVKTHILGTRDGATVRYFDTETEGPAVVLANGLGGPFDAWRHQVSFLSERYRVISWDYRGIFNGHATAPAAGGSRDEAQNSDLASSIRRHADDLAQVLDHLSIDSAAFVGWSLGAQVLLQFYVQAPSRVSHLVFLNGMFGSPLHNLNAPLAGRALSWALANNHLFRPLAERALKRAVHWPETPAWLKRLGFLAPTVEEGFFLEVAKDLAHMNFDGYFDTLAALGRHKHAPEIPRVDVPTLIIAGARDPLTPPDSAETLRSRCSDAELLVLPEGSHYSPIEFPEFINLRMEKFFMERGHGIAG